MKAAPPPPRAAAGCSNSRDAPTAEHAYPRGSVRARGAPQSRAEQKARRLPDAWSLSGAGSSDRVAPS